MAEMSKKDAFLAEKEAKIEDVMDRGGPMAHNQISIILRNVAQKYGHEEANKMVELFDLEAAFGIRPVEAEGKTNV